MKIDINKLDTKQRNMILEMAVQVLSSQQEEDTWDFGTSDEKKPSARKPKKRTPTGILDFTEMSLDKSRTEEDRYSPIWRQSCAEWLRKFKQMDQPVLIWYSKQGDPQNWTCYLREVKSERVEVTKIGGRVEERTFLYHLIYGIEIPDESYRVKGKEMMSRVWKIPGEDSKEFLKFRDQIQTSKPVDNRKKSATVKEQVGFVYEKQLEYHFNLLGNHVNLYGITKEREDEGVDHILIKNGRTSLVQAKAYSKKNRISKREVDIIYNNMTDFYEKHKNNQTLIIGELDRIILAVPDAEVLSDEARVHADKLGMQVEVIPIRNDWPKFKCVFNNRNRKAYYGPSDPPYNSTKMLADKRRFWADSEEEAQGKGFVRFRKRSS